MQDLTAEDRKMFDILKELIAKQGYAPTRLEIAAAAKRSITTVDERLRNLKAAGAITYEDNRGRTIRLLADDLPPMSPRAKDYSARARAAAVTIARERRQGYGAK